ENAKSLHLAKRRSVRKGQRRHNGHIAVFELVREAVLFKDLLAAPTSRSVKLRHTKSFARSGKGAFVIDLNLDLIDAVLHAVQRETPPRAAKSGRFDGIEYSFGSELVVIPRFLP